jgi:hypothetical protein
MADTHDERASLLPCPFCGGTKGHWEGCRAPDASGVPGSATDQADAIDGWNRRAALAQPSAEPVA